MAYEGRCRFYSVAVGSKPSCPRQTSLRESDGGPFQVMGYSVSKSQREVRYLLYPEFRTTARTAVLAKEVESLPTGFSLRVVVPKMQVYGLL